MKACPISPRASPVHLLGFGGLARAQTDAGFPDPLGDADIIVAGAKVEKLFEADCFSEGVSVGPDNMVYFSDITFTKFCKDASGRPWGGHIWRYDPRSRQATIFRSPSGMSNGTKFDREGNMLVAMGADFGLRVLMKIDMKTGRSSIVAGMYEGKPFNALNDISIDVKGRIYFTDPRYLGHEPVMADGFAAYRVDPDGKVTRVAVDCGKCNGIAVSPDQKKIYIVSNDNGFLAFENLSRARRRCRKHSQAGGSRPINAGQPAVWRLQQDASRPQRTDGLIADADGTYGAPRAPGGIAVSRRQERVHLHRQGDAHQRRLRARRHGQHPVHHLGQEPVSPEGGQARVSVAVSMA
jgi:sugar lactone lactonase YvrE